MGEGVEEVGAEEVEEVGAVVEEEEEEEGGIGMMLAELQALQIV